MTISTIVNGISYSFRKSVDKTPLTLLSKQWIQVCFVILFNYLFLILIAYKYYYHDAIPRYVLSFNPFTSTFNTSVIVSSISACAVQLLHVILNISNSSVNTISAHATILIIMLIQCLSELLHFGGIFNHSTEDIFGVKISAITIIEWISTVPVMFYLNLTLTSPKYFLTYEDYSIIISSFLFLLFSGFSTLLHFSFYNAIYTLIITSLLMMYALINNTILAYKNLSIYTNNNSLINEPDGYINYSIAQRRVNCSLFLLFFLPLYLFAFIFRMYNIISNDILDKTFAILNLIAKIGYCIVLTNGHLEILNPIKYKLLIQKKLSIERKLYMKYMFYEIRNPLNIINFNLNLLLNNNINNNEINEMNNLMSISTKSLIQSIDCIEYWRCFEENIIKLKLNNINCKNIIIKSLNKFINLIELYNINIIINIHMNVPKDITCDENLIVHSLSNFISNSIKFNNFTNNNNNDYNKSSIEIIVTYSDTIDTINCITFSVVDNGYGVDKEIIPYLFQPFNDKTFDYSVGFGLTLVKEIISLHHGIVSYEPNNRKDCNNQSVGGSIFSFSIPTNYNNNNNYEKNDINHTIDLTHIKMYNNEFQKVLQNETQNDIQIDSQNESQTDLQKLLNNDNNPLSISLHSQKSIAMENFFGDIYDPNIKFLLKEAKLNSNNNSKIQQKDKEKENKEQSYESNDPTIDLIQPNMNWLHVLIIDGKFSFLLLLFK